MDPGIRPGFAWPRVDLLQSLSPRAASAARGEARPYSAYPGERAGRGLFTMGVGHGDPGLTPHQDLQRGLPLVQPEPVPRTRPMRTRDTLRGHPGQAAPTVPRTATGRWRALTSPELGSPLERSWAPHRRPGLGGTAGPVGQWTRSGVRLYQTPDRAGDVWSRSRLPVSYRLRHSQPLGSPVTDPRPQEAS